MRDDDTQPTQPTPASHPGTVPDDFGDLGDTAVAPGPTDDSAGMGEAVPSVAGKTIAQLIQERFGWGWVIPVLLFLALVAAAVWLYLSLAFSWETAVTQRQITLFSDSFQPVILHKGVYTEVPFALTEQAAFIMGSTDPNSRADLMRLNLENGEVEWHAPAEDWQFPVVSAGIVYIEGNGNFSGALRALSAVSGREVWQRSFRVLGGTRVDYLSPVDDHLSVRLTGDLFGSYYLLDRETGRTVQQKRSDTEFVFLIDRDPLRVYEALPGEIRVTSRDSWQVGVDGFNLRPQVSGDVILVQYTPYDSQSDALIGINRQTGETLWQRLDPVISNTAVSGSYAFMLVSRGGGTQLLAIDMSTGEMAGSVLFSGDPNIEEAYHYFIAATETTTAVYFGDSRQLFLFNWLPQNQVTQP